MANISPIKLTWVTMSAWYPTPIVISEHWCYIFIMNIQASSGVPAAPSSSMVIWTQPLFVMNGFLVLYKLKLVAKSVFTIVAINILSFTVFEAMYVCSMLYPLLWSGKYCITAAAVILGTVSVWHMTHMEVSIVCVKVTVMTFNYLIVLSMVLFHVLPQMLVRP